MRTGHPKRVTTTQTELSSRRWLSTTVTTDDAFPEQPVPRPDEPNLYNFPSDFHPAYRPLPVLMNLVVAVVSMFLSAITTWERLTWLDPLMAVRTGTWNVRKLFKFAGKALIAGFLSTSVLQDVFLPPTRISTAKMMQNYFLPSTLSRYEPVPLLGRDPLGVHYLKCQSLRKDAPFRFSAIHCNHGFGASSLSWLPAMPRLMNRLGARVALAHDAPGFGFTDRPPNITTYTRGTSAQIGSSLLEENHAASPSEAVALFGHSMGAAATLRMALELPKETKKFIVLVAPALGLFHEPVKVRSRLRKLTRPARQFVRKYVFDPSFGYILRRVVGMPDFWKRSLRQFWGDPSRVSNSDALRFQWPSIGAGWERGLLSYSLAQARQGSSDGISDQELMERVLSSTNTTVAVIIGDKDRVVPKSMVNKFFDKFPNVKIYELEGQGHDPFEEQVDVFVETVERILDEENST